MRADGTKINKFGQRSQRKQKGRSLRVKNFCIANSERRVSLPFSDAGKTFSSECVYAGGDQFSEGFIFTLQL